MIACAAPAPRVELPASGARPTREAPPAPTLRTDGRSDGPSPRMYTVRLTTGGRTLLLEAWCREEVWTTLDGRVGIPFVLGESWSRLGARRPRRLLQTQNSVFQGALARLRPRPTGELDFVIEISRAGVESDGPKFEWQGADVRLPRPWQDGYRFAGVVPAGYGGVVANWGELVVEIQASGRTPATIPGIAFRAGAQDGFVAGGRTALAEFYTLRWPAADVVDRDRDGVLQARFSLAPAREATGFRYDVAQSRWIEFGEGFRVIAGA